MRKTITALTAVATLAVAPQAALADDPAATHTVLTSSSGAVTAVCQTPNRVGVAGAYGAWGHYIDGCTVRLACPGHVRVCAATSGSAIATSITRGQRVTLNSRMRAFSGSGGVIWFRDVSCAGWNTCGVTDLVHIRGGQSASVQCNGVRQSAHNSAYVRCSLRLEPLY